MNTISITYSSFAMPPVGIRTGRTYQFGKDKTGYFIGDIHGNQYMDVSNIKALFSPIEKTWEEVLSVKKTEDKE